MLDTLALAIFSFTSALIRPIALLLAVAHDALLEGDACARCIQRSRPVAFIPKRQSGSR